MKSKILYLADRNNLVDQSIQQDFAPLEKVIHTIYGKDIPNIHENNFGKNIPFGQMDILHVV